MGVINGTMWSDALGMNVGYSAVLPEGMKGPYEVLYLLHGHSTIIMLGSTTQA